jgi:ABC-type polysaccharide/polyol phosphate transport system ATPase subunit
MDLLDLNEAGKSILLHVIATITEPNPCTTQWNGVEIA